MNYRELIAGLTPQRGAGEARAIVRLVMEECFGLTQADLLLGKDTTLSRDDLAEFEKIASRLLSGEPVQYVLGFADFCGHRFRVTPDVLIPRPETEELVQWVLQEVGDRQPTAILDLCTGSGCIAVSLGIAVPQAHVVGIDVSRPALQVAGANASATGAKNVSFACRDVLEYLPADGEEYSLVVSNPPYVLRSESAGMEATVLEHEPHLALFVPDQDPLCFYRAIARIAQQVLAPGGSVLVEMNASLAEDTRQLFISSGFTDVLLREDQYGRPRMLRAKQNPIL